MNYRTKRIQIFLKKLDVPKYVEVQIFDNILEFNYYLEYDLFDKVPLSCLKDCAHKKIVEKIGIDKAKTLDWELINRNQTLIEIILGMDSNVEDINQTLYEYALKNMNRTSYSKKMIEKYASKVTLPEYTPDYIKESYYGGYIKVEEIIKNWEYFREIDLNFYTRYEYNISSDSLKDFMNNFGGIVNSFSKEEIKSLITELYVLNRSEETKNKFVRNLLETKVKFGHELDNNSFKTFFKHYPIEEFLKHKFNPAVCERVLGELKNKPADYIYNMPFSIAKFLDKDVLEIVSILGLENIVNFDNECGHFFSADNSKILKLLKSMYIDTEPKNMYELIFDKDRNHIYTRDEFYNVLRKMITYSPFNQWYSFKERYAKALSYYRVITGDFREKNPDLFIDQNANEELQNAFYNRSITLDFIKNNESYISILDGKNIDYCFGDSKVIVYDFDNKTYEQSLYNALSKKYDLKTIINFYSEYHQVLNIIFDEKNISGDPLKILSFHIADDLETIKSSINELFVKIILEKHIAFPNQIPNSLKSMYPNLFLESDVPEELRKIYYERKDFREYIKNNPEHIRYLKQLDVEFIFEYISIGIIDRSYTRNNVNLAKYLKDSFGDEIAFNIMFSYGSYLNKINCIDKSVTNDFLNYEDDLDHTIAAIEKIIYKNLVFKKIIYKDDLPLHFINKYPDLFLPKYTPEEIKNKFYNKELTTNDFFSNPKLIEYFENTKISHGFSQEFAWINKLFKGNNIKTNNELFIKIIEYYNKIENDKAKYVFLYYLSICDDFSNEKTDEIVGIISKYSQELNKGLDEEKQKLEFLRYLLDNSNVFDYETSFVFSVLIDQLSPAFYSNILDEEFKNKIKIYLLHNAKSIDVYNIESSPLLVMLRRLSSSNSSEINAFKYFLFDQLIEDENPIKSLEKIETMFLNNNMPTIGKVFSVFEILHPGDEMDVISLLKKISPTLREASSRKRKIIIFSDLLKSAFGSNNRSIKEYIKNIESSYNKYKSIINNKIGYELLDDKTKHELKTFSAHLLTLYKSTLKGRVGNEDIILSGNSIIDITKFIPLFSPNGETKYDLADRVISMFCSFAGINSLEEAKNYIVSKIKFADERNRIASTANMKIEKNDLVKGTNNINYLRNILQNGSVAVEYLGASSSHDMTPFDTDLSIVMSDEGCTRDKIEGLTAINYGPIFFVLKNDDRFILTRDVNGETNVNDDLSKLELFYTGVARIDHYGIRTGFASSEINYIVMDHFDQRVGVEIAKNGFYIPVANMDGKIIFTAQDYDLLRSKMMGLSYYDLNTYNFSQNLVSDEVLEITEQLDINREVTSQKRSLLMEKINSVLTKYNLELKTTIDGDLSDGNVELLDTGSTGRETNKIGAGDFDFIMRLDKKIISNPSKLQEIKNELLTSFGIKTTSETTFSGDFRLKDVNIDDTKLDIDITFTHKTDAITYSTDMSLKDRLETIKKIDPEKHKLVLANIVLAKQVLSDAHVYSSRHSRNPQGGLGGVGIENWILQNGGSFIDATKSFLDASENRKYNEFCDDYKIWDFGENHLAQERGKYPHDEFVSSNMDSSGYSLMKSVLKEYVNTHESQNSIAINM